MIEGILSIIIFGMLLAIGVIAAYAILIFNSLIRLRNNIEKSWSNIDVLLKQRNDEIPNLMKTVEGYMEHEKETFKRVTDARTSIQRSQTVHDKAVSDDLLTHALKTLFAVAENYPQLKANENFLALQKRITSLEDLIADRREFYNDTVTTYNIRIQQVPDTLIARSLSYDKKDLFKARSDERPPVDTVFG
ncbi:LemA family protein [Candidatus Altiarchaeota archaeon]